MRSVWQIFALVFYGGAILSGFTQAAPPRPNIIVILADDLGYADVGFTGGKEIRTPQLDALAKEGAVLSQFYVQPVCSPTRAALMTGRYPLRHGLQVGVVRPWAQYGLPLEEQTLPDLLRQAGYQTAIVGKWHLGHFQPAYLPTRRGFEHQYGHYNGALDYFTHVRDGGHDWHRDDQANFDQGYSTHLLAREAVRLIRERERAKPFFLYLAFNAVHMPHQVPDSYKEPYQKLEEPRRTYAGMVAAMDEAIGQVVGAVESENLAGNTLIVFSSDNGKRPGKISDNGPLRAGKASVYEGGVRVAALVRWKGQIRAGTTVAAPLHIVDWYPTLLRLAGSKAAQKLPLDGRDLWPALVEGKPSPHDAILLNATPTGGAIRMGDWKLVLNGAKSDPDQAPEDKPSRPPPPLELFNLASDFREKTNLAGVYPEKVRELQTRYESYAREQVPPKAAPASPGFKAPKVWGETP